MTHDVDNPLQVYLREVAKVSLLTPAIEKQLIDRVQEAGEDSEIAKKDLVEAHLRQVVSIAQEHTEDTGRLLDLIQAGNLGLLKAANELDGSSDAPFSAHADSYIRQAIAKAQ